MDHNDVARQKTPQPPEGMSPTSSSPWTRLADRQWNESRPRLVKWLKKRNLYRRALRKAADLTADEMFAALKRGVQPFVARSEAMSMSVNPGAKRVNSPAE